MVKRIMMTLVLSALLNVGHSFAMENPNNTNPDTVNRIAGIIRDLGLQQDNTETRDILSDALQGVSATDEETREAFMKVESEGKQGPQKQKPRELTPTEKENAYRMWLQKQYLEKMAKEEANEGTLPEVLKDVQSAIGQPLHEVTANPVLDGELVYTDEGKKTSFKIMDLVKNDGTFDLSNKDVFGDSSDYLLITTDPEKFFNIVEDSYRLVILIAPRFLIEEKIWSSTAPFQPIMAKWKEKQAPIGIFYRMEYWKNQSWYDYLTSANLLSISKNNLYKNWSVSNASSLSQFVWPGGVLHAAMQKISCLFLTKDSKTDNTQH